MNELVDTIAGDDHVIVPLERLELASQKDNRLDFNGLGRACHLSKKAHFHQLLSTGSCSWLTSFSEKETDMAVSLDIVTPRIFRLQVARNPEKLYRQTEMAINDIHENFQSEIQENEQDIIINTGVMEIRICKNPYRIAVYDSNGVSVAELGGFERQHTKPWDALPTGFVVKSDGTYTSEQFRFMHDEEMLGFGERFLGMRRRGQTVRNWSREGKGNHTNRIHKPIPFVVSTKGYGLYYNTSVPFTAWLGSQSAYEASLLIEEDVLDFYFFYGPDLPDVVSQYTSLTGRAKMPPEWSFGLWMSRDSYRSSEEALTVAKRLREEKIPCDVIHLDPPWMGSIGTVCQFTPSPEWGDFEATLKELHDLNFRVSIWQMPYISEYSTDFEDGMKHGALVETWAPDNPPLRTGVIDFSKPEGVAWYKEKIENLLRIGADVIKVDFGETVPVNVDYHKYSGAEMHNLYGMLYGKAAWEITRDVKGEDNALTWSRPGYAGSQRYPIHWSADPHANFGTLASVLKSGLSLSLAGFTFWANDLGGYFGTPTPELYMRWTQLAFFCSHVRAHGGSPREPWEFGEEAMANFRKYVELRYRLLPYIFEEAKFAAENGLPFIRPLVLDYQDDPTTHFIEDEYLFGRSILVAPVLAENAKYRKVYIPEGKWQDFWNMENTVTGPCWIECETPLDHLPLFVKAGVEIPQAEPRQYIE